jgi:hypothetical protein
MRSPALHPIILGLGTFPSLAYCPFSLSLFQPFSELALI